MDTAHYGLMPVRRQRLTTAFRQVGSLVDVAARAPRWWVRPATESRRLVSFMARLPAGRVVGMLKQGDKAPDLTLLDQNGEPFSLSESIKRRKAWHLTYFYP